MPLRTILVVLFCLATNLHSTSALAASSEDKAAFKLFDGAWDITEGPLVGMRLLLGKSGRSGKNTFALVVPNTTGFLRLGEITSYKNDKIKGKFSKGSLPAGVTDPATIFGLTEGGKFSLSIVPSSIYKITGNLTGSNKQSFSLTAVAEELVFHNAKFVLEIEATKKKQFNVGESVTFDVTAELRGPAGVIPEQPELQIAFDDTVKEISVRTIKNFTACTVDTARTPNQVACSFASLGPKQTEAKLQVIVTAPQELAGKRLEAAVGVDDNPAYDPTLGLNPIFPSGAVRKAGVKIKKGQTGGPTPTPTPPPGTVPAACLFLAGQWTTSVGSLNLISDGNYTSVESGSPSFGLWTCEMTGSTTFLLLGLDTASGPFFPNRYAVSADGKHFEGNNQFGFPFSGDKL